MIQAGDTIGPYTLIRTLGRGAFGEVWLAERRSSLITTQVALKLPLDANADLEAIRTEAQVWLRASGHPNIVPLIDAEVYAGQVLIASEYVSGGSLQEWLAQHGGKARSVDAAVQMMGGILEGLQHLHESGLIHRDLKPSNVMVQMGKPRLTDFGLTRVLKPTGHTSNLAGTPGYMAPEAFRGEYSPASDVWAAGILLHEMLVGALPYPETNFYPLFLAITSEPPVALSDHVPDALGPVLTRALAKSTTNRFASAAEMARALHAADASRAASTINSRPAGTNNLPAQMTSFIGRGKEMVDVKAILAKTRLLTLTGSGGCGKTRLLLQVASDLIEDYADGVWLVELASLADPGLVPQAVATVLEVREEPGKPQMQTLAQALKPRKLLLLLDNCEHVLDAAAGLADALLRHCPDVRILTSSRESLGTPGERTYRVPSLSLPTGTGLAGAHGIADLLVSEAVRLFGDRAVLLNSDFALTDANAPAVARVCRRLDGIPLAIELAAARVRSLPVEQIEARLDDRFRLLTGGSRTALPRHQTLRALIDWSYDYLAEKEQRLLRRVSVFAGGWSLEAAEKVCGNEEIEEWEMLDLLTALVDKSLVIYEERRGDVRYRLLDTVRQYAVDRRTESGESGRYTILHRNYFLALAELSREKLRGPEQAAWLDRMESEHDNLRQALTFCLEQAAGGDLGLRLGAAMNPFWRIRGHISEGRVRLAALLALPEARKHTKAYADALGGAAALANIQGDYASARSMYQESLEIYGELMDRQGVANSILRVAGVSCSQGDYTAARSLNQECLEIFRQLGDKHGIADSLCSLGLVAYRQGDYVSARSLHQESLEIQRGLGDVQGIANALSNLGIAAYRQGDYASARSLHQECLETFRQLGNKHGIASSLVNLANVAYEQSDCMAANSLYQESLAIFRQLGNRQGVAQCLNNLGLVTYRLGDWVAARALHQESRDINRELGDRRGIADCLNNLGLIAYMQGDYGSARALHQESLEIYREIADRRGISDCLYRLGQVAVGQDDYAFARNLHQESLAIRREIGNLIGIVYSLESIASLYVKEDKREQAARLWGAVERLCQEIGLPLLLGDRDEQDRKTAEVRAALGENDFATAWNEGCTMTMEQAIEYALEDTGSPTVR
jgi:predicted ATPase